MRKALFFAALFFAQSVFAQTVIGTKGVTYTDGAPAHNPGTAGSQLVWDATNKKDYLHSSGTTWLFAGHRLQSISGCAAPAYTPTGVQSWFVANACDTPAVYLWNGAAWDHLNGQTPVAWGHITGTLSNQTDLQTALNGKLSTGATFAGDVSGLYSSLQLGAGVVGPTELASTAVTPGSYAVAAITVDAQGRITAAASGSAITSLNGLTGSTQTFAAGTSGTDFAISSSGTAHTFNLPTASASNRGALSSADWSTFNSKVGGSGTSGYIPKFTGTGTIGNSSTIYDNSGKIVINGTASDSLFTISYTPPALGYYFPVMLSPPSAGSATNAFYGIGWSPTGNGFNAVAGIAAARIGGTTGDLALFASANRTNKMGASSIRLYVVGSTGNVGINTTAPNYKFEVNGDMNLTAGYNYRSNGVIMWGVNGSNVFTNSPVVVGGNTGDSTLTVYKACTGTSVNLPMMITGNGNTANAWEGIGWSPTGNGYNAVAAIVANRPTSTVGQIGFATSSNRGNKMTPSDIRMIINENGYVGIGITSSLAARLHIVGPGATSATYDFQVHNSTGANNALVVRSDGKIGIGTAAPAQTLHVAGTARITGSDGTPTVLMGRDGDGDIAGMSASATATLDFPDTAAGTVSDLTLTVTGAAVGDVVTLGVPHGSVPASGVFFGWVSAANTVTIRFANNALITSYNPASGLFKATVIK